MNDSATNGRSSRRRSPQMPPDQSWVNKAGHSDHGSVRKRTMYAKSSARNPPASEGRNAITAMARTEGTSHFGAAGGGRSGAANIIEAIHFERTGASPL